MFIVAGLVLARDLFLKDLRAKGTDAGDMQMRAYDVLDELGMRRVMDGGVRIVEIMEYFGIRVYMDDLRSDGLKSYIVVDPLLMEKLNGNRIACVDSKLSDGDKRFALAHVFAQYLFDYNDYEDVSFYGVYMKAKNGCTSDQNRNRRAERFAFRILMPADAFLEKYTECRGRLSKPDLVNELDRYFRVTPQMVMKRLGDLKVPGYQNQVC